MKNKIQIALALLMLSSSPLWASESETEGTTGSLETPLTALLPEQVERESKSAREAQDQSLTLTESITLEGGLVQLHNVLRSRISLPEAITPGNHVLLMNFVYDTLSTQKQSLAQMQISLSAQNRTLEETREASAAALHNAKTVSELAIADLTRKNEEQTTSQAGVRQDLEKLLAVCQTSRTKTEEQAKEISRLSTELEAQERLNAELETAVAQMPAEINVMYQKRITNYYKQLEVQKNALKAEAEAAEEPARTVAEKRTAAARAKENEASTELVKVQLLLDAAQTDRALLVEHLNNHRAAALKAKAIADLLTTPVNAPAVLASAK